MQVTPALALPSQIPIGFTTAAQYDATIAAPLSRHVNTEHTFSTMARPPVIKRAGVIIKPLQYDEELAERLKRKSKSGKRVSKVSATTVLAGGRV